MLYEILGNGINTVLTSNEVIFTSELTLLIITQNYHPTALKSQDKLPSQTTSR
jgi:hypothetical protein